MTKNKKIKRAATAVCISVMVLICAFPGSAQITITIPKIPKIKKPKTVPTITTTPTDNGETGRTSDTAADSTKASADDEMDFRLKFFLDEITKAQRSVDEYTPEEKIYLVGGGEYDWLLRAVSPKAREEWSQKWLNKPNERNKFNSALDALAASAAKKLPLYQANPKSYNFHNPAEEKMMKGTLENLASLKIFKIGLNQANWLIDKNDLGIPTARYKNGMLWVRDSADDHLYCRFYYVNIIQDYAGGGRYGASYAKFTGGELAGCPAAAK